MDWNKNFKQYLETLQTTREEMQSSQDELKSTNEEMTTSREEMQSLNEELQTDISISRDAAHLRGSAEEPRREIPAHPELPRTQEEIQRLFHELEVHRVELEMQNEQLRQARDDLEKALARYSDLYDFAPVGYFTIDCDSSIRSANLSGATLLGIERSRLIGRQLRQLIADEDRLLFTEFIKGIFANQGRKYCEVTFTRDGHNSIIADIEANFTTTEQVCRLAVIDISERKRIENTLLNSEERYRSLFEVESDALSAEELLAAVTDRIHRHKIISLHHGNSVFHKERTILRTGVTNREKEVLKLVGQGVTSKVIAERFGVS